MQQFRFKAPLLPLVSETTGYGVADSLETERTILSPAEVVELDDERYVVRAETSSEVKLCKEEGPFLVYGGGEPTAPKVKAVCSKRRKLSSLMTWMRRMIRKTETRSGGSEEDGVNGADTRELKGEVDEQKVTTVGSEVATVSSTEAGIVKS